MSNSPTIMFFRAAAMMALLVTILTIAVCWNSLPSIPSDENLLPISWKHIFQQDQEEKKTAPKLQESFPPLKPSDTENWDKVDWDRVDWDPPTKIISLGEEASLRYGDIPNAISNDPGPNPAIDPWDDGPVMIPYTDWPADLVVWKRTLEQEYGATGILLEPWGNEGQLYRFSCYVSQPKGSGVKKLHQAIQATPALAIQKVMEAVRL